MDTVPQTLSDIRVTDQDMSLLLPAKYVSMFLTMLSGQSDPHVNITEEGLLEFCYQNNLIDGENRLFSVTVNGYKLSFWSHKSMSVWNLFGNPLAVAEVISTIAKAL